MAFLSCPLAYLRSWSQQWNRRPRKMEVLFVVVVGCVCREAKYLSVRDVVFSKKRIGQPHPKWHLPSSTSSGKRNAETTTSFCKTCIAVYPNHLERHNHNPFKDLSLFFLSNTICSEQAQLKDDVEQSSESSAIYPHPKDRILPN